MRRIYIVFITLLLFVSCNVTKDLVGDVYSYKSKRRTLQLIFDNDSICRIKNIFHCKDIDEEIKEITTVCEYIRVEDTIYLKNIDCEHDTCEYGLFMDIPFQNSKKCYFLNEEHRRARALRVGPSYKGEYRKYGIIPKIDVDTLYILKNEILFYKQSNWESVGFFFK